MPFVEKALKNAYIGNWWAPNENTLSYFPFKTDYVDKMGNRTLTLNGCSISDWSMNISSNSSYMLLSSAVGWSKVTVSLWYQPSAFNSNGRNTVICRNWWTYHHLLISWGNSTEWTIWKVWFWNNSWWASNKVVSAWDWYHFVIVKDWTNEKIYVDWEKVLDSNSSFDNNSYPIEIIANYGTNWDQWAQWKMSELIFEKVCRTDSEVLSYYNSTRKTYEGGEREPNVNTVWYRPLESDCKDYSWNWYDGTWSSPSYTKSWTINNVAYFNGSYIDLSTFRITEDNTTINVWVKSTSTNSWQEVFDANDDSGSTTSVTYFWYNWPWGVSNQYWMQHAVPWWSYWVAYTSWWPFQDVWKNICVVMNTSWIKIYMNWVLQSTSSNLSWRMVWTPDASIWWRKHWNENFFRWYISEFIWENKARTTKEILNYYNSTKWNYWL